MISRRSMLGRTTVLATLAGLAGCGGPAAAVPARAPGVPEPIQVRYGDHPQQYAELHLPATGEALAVVVVLHGGYWRAGYGAELGTPLAVDLANAGLATWNLEYRTVRGGGGWPVTFTDVAAGVDALQGRGQRAALGRLDLGRTVFLGHSAGGQLAVWAAGRHRLPAGAPGAAPAVRPLGAVSQAGVLDLIDGARQGLGGGAVTDLLGGGPDTVADRYRLASPAELVPLGVPVVCVHGTADQVVPPRQSERFVAAAGAEATLELIEGIGHFELIDPSTQAWTLCRDALTRLLDVG